MLIHVYLLWNSQKPLGESHYGLFLCENRSWKLAAGYRVYYACAVTGEVLYFRRVERRLSG
jgi:hypothetical protein